MRQHVRPRWSTKANKSVAVVVRSAISVFFMAPISLQLVCLLVPTILVFNFVQSGFRSTYSFDIRGVNVELSAVASGQDPTSTSGSSPSAVVYMAQGPASSYERLREKFSPMENAVFFYHAFDHDVCKNANDCIFRSNTTLPEGRNLVLQTAWNAMEQRSLDASLMVKYYVLMDDDVEIVCTNPRRDCWWEYHTMLLDPSTSWPFIAPKYYVDGDNEPDSWHTCRDDSFWVMRPDSVHMLYPYPTRHQTKTWNVYVMAVWERMKRCLPNGFLTHAGYRNVNARHGSYPQGLRKGLVVDILNSEYPELGPWNRSDIGFGGRPAFRCTAALTGPPSHHGRIDPICEELTRTRFQKWINGQYEP